MVIQILGSGCQICKKLHQLVEEVVREAGNNDVIEYISGEEGTQKILELGLMRSPVLVVNGVIRMVHLFYQEVLD
jgi:thiol-disulfide isomerase/thioredoxin